MTNNLNQSNKKFKDDVSRKLYVSASVRKFRNVVSLIKNKDDLLTLLIHLGYLIYDIEEKMLYT